MKTVLLLFFFYGVALQTTGQSKQESEKKIPAEKMPIPALNSLEEYLTDVKKLRYFLETDGANISYEAKFQYRKRSISVEFSQEGLLEDIEIIKKYTELPEPLQNAIEHYLSKHTQSFKIIRCQEQYRHEGTAPQKTISDVLGENWTNPLFYELEVDLRIDKTWRSEEWVFDQQGKFISKRHIINRAQDNLLY